MSVSFKSQLAPKSLEFKPSEIIISDNASEDNTTDIVNSFSSEKIKYIKREKNRISRIL